MPCANRLYLSMIKLGYVPQTLTVIYTVYLYRIL